MADSPIRIVNEGYPFCFERGENESAMFIAINLYEREYSLTVDSVEPLIFQNSEYENGVLKMKDVSLFIGLKH